MYFSWDSLRLQDYSQSSLGVTRDSDEGNCSLMVLVPISWNLVNGPLQVGLSKTMWQTGQDDWILNGIQGSALLLPFLPQPCAVRPPVEITAQGSRYDGRPGKSEIGGVWHESLTHGKSKCRRETGKTGSMYSDRGGRKRGWHDFAPDCEMQKFVC